MHIGNIYKLILKMMGISFGGVPNVWNTDCC